MRRLLLTAVLGLAACGEADVPPPPAREFDGAAALRWAEAQVAFGPRIPGTPAHARMANWLDSLARAKADTVITDRWNHVTRDGDTLPMVNVLARFRPDLATRILYLAHWDTRPHSDAAGSSDSLAPVPGANDGASGVAILLGLMEILEATPPTVGVDLLFVDGEDYGSFSPEQYDVLIGSLRYAANIPAPGRPEFAVVWDMVGAAGAKFGIESQGQVAAPDVVDRIWGLAERMGYGHIFIRQSIGSITDDHVPLIKAGIRAIDVIGWPFDHWHTPDDTMDKLSAETLEAVGNVAMAVIREAGLE
jgi:glutaminyl-peptide cyclotransferase